MNTRRPLALRSLLFALTAITSSGVAQAQVPGSNSIRLTGPAWEIDLTDYGYSDYLGDLTPGFNGREYLSGEWGGAVGYKHAGGTKSPTWLEPNFIAPDWITNSDFNVISSITQGANNVFGLPTASSVIANNQLKITQRFEIVDTRTGIVMGNAAASLGGSGASLLSNRYVLTQSYNFENISGGRVDDLQFFQFLHGLTAQSGVYDSRSNYGGAMPEYRYDVTLGGDAIGDGLPGEQYDYIGFHSKKAPSAVEIGAYGVEGNGVDDHSIGKPVGSPASPFGTHLSVEGNTLNGADQYAPTALWVAGAQRFELGSLEAGQSADFDVTLSILTGYQAPSGGSGEIVRIAGGSSNPGGVDAEFLGDHTQGLFYLSFEQEDPAELAAMGLGPLPFGVPGSTVPLWNIEYDGSFSGGLRLTFGYDPSLLAGVDKNTLHIYHWHNGAWEDLGGNFDLAGGTITVSTDSLSPFALGVSAVPEPDGWALMVGGLGVLLWRSKRQLAKTTSALLS